MSNMLVIAAALALVLLPTATMVMLLVVLRRTRQPHRPRQGFLSTFDGAVTRETLNVMAALDASIARSQKRAPPIMPDRRLLAEVCDEGVGLLCGIAVRPGPARLRIKKAVHDRVKKADLQLEDTMRAWLLERPCKVAVERGGHGEIVLLDGQEYLGLEKRHEGLLRNAASTNDYRARDGADGFFREKKDERLVGLEPADLWTKAYEGAERPGERIEPFYTLAVGMPDLKGVRKDFEAAYDLRFGRDVPPPHSDARKTPLAVSVREAELAYHIILEWVWRLASGKSRRLNESLWLIQRLRAGTLQVFPAYATALETAATEQDASYARSLGEKLHTAPHNVVTALAACMTDMEKHFSAAGVFACVEARAEKQRAPDMALDWSFLDRPGGDHREPRHPAPAYSRTLGSRSFRRKMATLLGEENTKCVAFSYDDAMAARKLRAKVAAACREHGASLLENSVDMAAVVENHPYEPIPAALTGSRLKRSKVSKRGVFQQAVDDSVALALCKVIQPPAPGD